MLAEACPNFDPGSGWRGGPVRVVAETPIFRLTEVNRSSPHSGKEGVFYSLECPQWVHAIPFADFGSGPELIAVEQHRHGICTPSLEVPGGVCGQGEDPLAAAKRELLEETGFASEDWRHLGSCTPNPAIQDNRCHFFLALGCARTRPLELDPTEELRVWAMPFSEWEARMKSGEVHHGLMLAAFQRLRLSPEWPTLRKLIAGRGTGS